jgi:hypothetical protein
MNQDLRHLDVGHYFSGEYSWYCIKESCVTDLYRHLDAPGVWRAVFTVYRHGKPVSNTHLKYPDFETARLAAYDWIKAPHAMHGGTTRKGGE